jgi:hypothetical protein
VLLILLFLKQRSIRSEAICSSHITIISSRLFFCNKTCIGDYENLYGLFYSLIKVVLLFFFCFFLVHCN